MKKIERFLSKVYPEPNTGCWLWGGALRITGDGTFTHGTINAITYDGFSYAHRYSYFIHKGDFDRSLFVCHTCDVPWCVNPDHLFLGTHQDNTDDCVKKKRHKFGEKGPHKMTIDTVKLARQMKADGHPQKDIADFFNVSESLISNIVTGKYWTHI